MPRPDTKRSWAQRFALAVAAGRRGEREAFAQMDPQTRAKMIGALFGLLAAIPVVLILAFVADAYGWNSDWMYLRMAAVGLAGMIGGAAWRKRRLRQDPAAATVGSGVHLWLRIYCFALLFCVQAWCVSLLVRDSANSSLVVICISSVACIPGYVAQFRRPMRLVVAIPAGSMASIAAALGGFALATQLSGTG